MSQEQSAMAESKSNPYSISSSGLNLSERSGKDYDEGKRLQHQHHGETHGLRYDIDEETPIADVKAPNVFQRVKEEIEAVVHSIRPKKSHEENRNYVSNVKLKPESPDFHSVKHSKSPNLIEKASKDIEAVVQKKAAHHNHHKETHGTSDDIDENTPISEVKAPNVFERAKEEIEAIFEAIHPKKDPGNAVSPPKKEGGFMISVGRGLEDICSSGSHNRD